MLCTLQLKHARPTTYCALGGIQVRLCYAFLGQPFTTCVKQRRKQFASLVEDMSLGSLEDMDTAARSKDYSSGTGRGRGAQGSLSPWSHTSSLALTNPGAAERLGSHSLTHSVLG
jgi:hypothetical protein